MVGPADLAGFTADGAIALGFPRFGVEDLGAQARSGGGMAATTGRPAWRPPTATVQAWRRLCGRWVS